MIKSATKPQKKDRIVWSIRSIKLQQWVPAILACVKTHQKGNRSSR